MWPVRITLAKLRPFNGSAAVKLSISLLIFAAFMYGDFALFDRLFRGIAQIEKATPFFALGLLRNVLALAFLVAVTMLFSSSMTVAIGSFFNDLDLDTLHAAPMRKSRLVLSRWFKTFFQSAAIVYIFTIPIFVAFAKHYRVGGWFYPEVLANLGLLLSIPVTLGTITIVLLVRFFPVQRVHQIVASLGILVISVAVIGFRASRPERFFRPISTDDLARVLKTIELPSMERYPGTALADLMVSQTEGQKPFPFPARIFVPALALFAIFMIIATHVYFRAFVRARESLAPTAIGATSLTGMADRLIRGFDLPTRAMIGKEVRVLVRDVAQWSQLFLMAALMVLYMYNMRMLPLGGDVRAAVVAYANVAMAGFIVAAICLRFAYPSVSAEGKAFWLMRTAPVSYRRLLIAKVLVYSIPLTVLSLLLTTFANIVLDANRVVWGFTLAGASLLAVTLVSLGVGLGALSPNFAAENPLQVGLSLGGFGYMGASLAYIAIVMLLMARTVIRYFLWKFFDVQSTVITTVLPVAGVIAISIALAVIPIAVAEKRLATLSESR
jgi:ABC-2 type transport system permease protein